METSPVNRLPEADSLPDGFVESSSECHSAPEFGDRPDETRVSVENPKQDELSEAVENLTISTDSFAGKDGLGPSGDSVEVENRVLEPKGDGGPPEDYKELHSVRSTDEILIGLPDSRGDCRSSQRDTEGCVELHTTDTKKRSAEHAQCLKNQKLESSEVKRKVGKRNMKSDKELLELTLNYHKVVAERDAAVAVRERLESLCRELQRHNKLLMDKYERVSTEGQKMRLDLSSKFNDTIKEVTIKLEEQKDECLAQLKENEMLRNKLNHLADQYTHSEEQFAEKLNQKMLELQIADLKLQQQQERSGHEQTQIQLYVDQVTQLLATEKNLRLQLAADGEKFQQFQDALLKSNEVFETFKQEMEKMGKSMKELKKENAFLKGKCDKSDIAIVKLVEERELTKKQLEKLKNQKEKLESLCRSLQAERKQSSVSSNSDQGTSQGKIGSSES